MHFPHICKLKVCDQQYLVVIVDLCRKIINQSIVYHQNQRSKKTVRDLAEHKWEYMSVVTWPMQRWRTRINFAYLDYSLPAWKAWRKLISSSVFGFVLYVLHLLFTVYLMLQQYHYKPIFPYVLIYVLFFNYLIRYFYLYFMISIIPLMFLRLISMLQHHYLCILLFFAFQFIRVQHW